MISEFFHPFFVVASWFVGIFGGLIFGLFVICTAVFAVVVAIFIIVWLFVSAMETYAGWKHRCALRRIGKKRADASG